MFFAMFITKPTWIPSIWISTIAASTSSTKIPQDIMAFVIRVYIAFIAKYTCFVLQTSKTTLIKKKQSKNTMQYLLTISTNPYNVIGFKLSNVYAREIDCISGHSENFWSLLYLILANLPWPQSFQQRNQRGVRNS